MSMRWQAASIRSLRDMTKPLPRLRNARDGVWYVLPSLLMLSVFHWCLLLFL